jgi:hypothetical protein
MRRQTHPKSKKAKQETKQVETSRQSVKKKAKKGQKARNFI